MRLSPFDLSHLSSLMHPQQVCSGMTVQYLVTLLWRPHRKVFLDKAWLTSVACSSRHSSRPLQEQQRTPKKDFGTDPADTRGVMWADFDGQKLRCAFRSLMSTTPGGSPCLESPKFDKFARPVITESRDLICKKKVPTSSREEGFAGSEKLACRTQRLRNRVAVRKEIDA